MDRGRYDGREQMNPTNIYPTAIEGPGKGPAWARSSLVALLIAEAKTLLTVTENHLWCQLQSANIRVRRANARQENTDSSE